jgi:glycosyltransferase involved in cell wall biosynthesis
MLKDQFRIFLVSSSSSVNGLERFGGSLGSLIEDEFLVEDHDSVATRMAAGIWHGWPIQVSRAYDRRLHALLRQVESSTAAYCTYYSLVRTAPYLQGRRTPALVDFCDCLSLQMRRKSAFASNGMRSVLRLESRLLKRFEDRVSKQADATMITSSVDAGCFSSPPFVVSNAYDVPEAEFAAADNSVSRLPSGKSMVFTGDMSTQYSESSAVWFAEEVLPLVKRSIPEAEFWIVGRSPTQRLTDLASTDTGVFVTGAVPKVSTYLRHAGVAVAPLRFGTGVKNKVLEAFAVGTPVVATPIADEGMGAAEAGALIAASTPCEMADAIVSLLDSPLRRDAQVGRASVFAEAQFSRPAITSKLMTAVKSARERSSFGDSAQSSASAPSL